MDEIQGFFAALRMTTKNKKRHERDDNRSNNGESKDNGNEVEMAG